MLVPDISSQLSYCFDIILLLSLVSDADINVYFTTIQSPLFFSLFYWHNMYIIISNERACITWLIPYLH